MPPRPYRPLVASLLALLPGLIFLPAPSSAVETVTPPPAVVRTRLAVAPLPYTGEVVRIDEVDYPVPASVSSAPIRASSCAFFSGTAARVASACCRCCAKTAARSSGSPG